MLCQLKKKQETSYLCNSQFFAIETRNALKIVPITYISRIFLKFFYKRELNNPQCMYAVIYYFVLSTKNYARVQKFEQGFFKIKISTVLIENF